VQNINPGTGPVSFTIDGKPVKATAAELSVRQLLELAEVDSAVHRVLILNDDQQTLKVDLDEIVAVEAAKFETARVYIYHVDGEIQFSVVHELTVREILSNAGVDPADHYLVQMRESGPPVEYRDINEKLTLHEGERFTTVYHGPTPVS
jgi:hypothetical protein